MAELYVVYGFAFLVLAVAIFLQPRRDRRLPFVAPWGLLGLFGLLHGGQEWSEAWRLLHPEAPSGVDWFNGSLLLLSYMALFEFGRRLAHRKEAINPGGSAAQPFLGAWIYLPLGLGVAGLVWLAEEPLTGLMAGARYCFGFPGALASGLAFWAQAEERKRTISPSAGRCLHVAGAALIVYSLAAGLVVRGDPAFPEGLPTTESFQQSFGFPVQALRAACAFVLTAALILMIRKANAKAEKREKAAMAETARLNASLARRVRESTASLEETNRSLQAEIEERKRIEARLLENQHLLDTIANNSPAMIRLCGLDRNCNFFNQAWLEFTGLSFDEATGEGWTAVVHPEDAAEYLSVRARAFENGTPFDVEYRLRRRDGIYRWVLEQSKPRLDAAGELIGFIGTCLDITDRKQNEARFREAMAQLRDSEQKQRELAALARSEQSRLRALLAAMRLGILFEDREHRVEYVNPAFLRMWAIGEEFDPVGRWTLEVIEHSSRRFSRPEHASGLILQALHPHELGESLELGFEDGRILTQASYPVTDADGRLIGRMWLYEDITHERQTAEQLLYLAERDPLTGLYNRHRFQEQLERSIAAALRNGTGFALVYFDLDEFKYINDTFGHKAGDTVLVRIAGEVGTLVRGIDMFARLGGDEFAILSNLKPGDDPKVLPARIISAIGAIPFRFRGSNLRMTGSVGVAIFPEHGDNAEDLVAHADAAMYQAKARGKNTWTLYDPRSEVSESMVRRLSWNRRMAEALEQGSFELHFQGVFDIGAAAPSHLEVLVRMRDPADPARLILPGQFLPAAEKSGQIAAIDRWVLARSIELLGRDPALPPLSVNISGRSFEDPFLPQFIRGKLLEHKVDPRRLIVELTEAAAVSDIQAAQRFIEAVKQAGCRVCLDNFGSGFATFGYLKFLGAELLKIDGVFIRDLPNNPENQVFVKAMVDVARGLDKTLVAESVEDAATLELIRTLGVRLVQGYHLDRPAARGLSPEPEPAGPGGDPN